MADTLPRLAGITTVGPGRRPRLRSYAVPTLIAAAIALGCLVRAYHVLSAGFPLNDGGLFYAMTEDLRHNGYRLPEFTSYNQESIPFGYPPLGFYATGFVAGVTPLSLLDGFRFLPLLASCLTIPAFYLLSRRLMPSQAAVAASVFAFALVPRSFVWMLMGGGVTRAPGFLFAILALVVVQRLYAERRWACLPAAAALCALTLLSHLEAAWFLAVSIGLFFLAFGRHRMGVAASLALAGSTLLLAAPWWVEVLSDHGTGPFRASFETGGSFFTDAATRRFIFVSLARGAATSEPFFPLIGALALLGAIVSLATRRWFLPAWCVAIVLLDARAFPTFTTVPVAMLAGVGLVEVVLPALVRAGQAQAVNGNGRTPATLAAPRAAGLALLAFAAFATFAAVERAPGMGGEGEYLRGLSRDERRAMSWVSAETPAEARFLVVPDTSWETARAAEWFPLLAQRVSVATVQGSEWLPDQEFGRRVDDYYYALDCGFKTSVCLDQWSQATGRAFSYVYVRKTNMGQCCATLVTSLREDVRYAVVYDGPGATIFAAASGPPAVSTEHKEDVPAGP